MATKPTSTPRWADVGGSIVDPPSGTKDVGWLVGQKPPAQYLNWWKNLSYQWFEYLKDGIFSGAFGLSTSITPSAITGSNDNYAPTDHATTAEIRQDLSAAATLTGLAGGAGGRIVILRNLNATYDLKLAHDITSTAANRFSLPESKDLYLVGINSYAVLKYSATLSRWVVIATNGRQPKTLWLSGPAFTPSEPAVDDVAIGGAGVTSTGINSIYAHVPLPAGTRLTEIIGHAIHSDAVYNRQFALHRSTLPAGSTVTIGSHTIGTVSATVEHVVTNMPHTMLEYPYSLYTTLTNGTTWDVLTGVKINYY